MKSSKKAARFNETQKRYLQEKSNLEKLSGHKFDPTVIVFDAYNLCNMHKADKMRQRSVAMPRGVATTYARMHVRTSKI